MNNRFENLKEKFGLMIVALANRYYFLMKYATSMSMIRAKYRDLRQAWVMTPEEMDLGPYLKSHRCMAVRIITQKLIARGYNKPEPFRGMDQRNWAPVIRQTWPSWVKDITCELIAKNGRGTVYIKGVGLVIKADGWEAIVEHLTALHLALTTYREDFEDKDYEDTELAMMRVMGAALDPDDPRSYGENPQAYLDIRDVREDSVEYWTARSQYEINKKEDESVRGRKMADEHKGFDFDETNIDRHPVFADDRDELLRTRGVIQGFAGQVAWFDFTLTFHTDFTIMRELKADQIKKIKASGLPQALHTTTIPNPRDHHHGSAPWYPRFSMDVKDTQGFFAHVQMCLHDPDLYIPHRYAEGKKRTILDHDVTELKAKLNPATMRTAGVVAVSTQFNRDMHSTDGLSLFTSERPDRINKFRWVLISGYRGYTLWMMTFAQDWVDLGLIKEAKHNLIGIEVSGASPTSNSIKEHIIELLCPCLPIGWNGERYDVTVPQLGSGKLIQRTTKENSYARS